MLQGLFNLIKATDRSPEKKGSFLQAACGNGRFARRFRELSTHASLGDRLWTGMLSSFIGNPLRGILPRIPPRQACLVMSNR